MEKKKKLKKPNKWNSSWNFRVFFFLSAVKNKINIVYKFIIFRKKKG